ncbi:FAD-dependent tricarballylate dehydrogenase TcuA [Cereibacter johrii]|uniref:Tricarballylate dehydrogenase n=1 Tax=Cereibacter johrii TaxID=445629 RepID=A0ABX5J3N6_9RHOB|nr:FAD-dependent tricarballylate dehydrogenase TcuA [Cereibacter johrii]ODM42486.1 tricarballylate dehydrogenase [Cereibacter johrii]PTM76755.1 tricarballylate dehydrogenase [Cereibacter johrii]
MTYASPHRLTPEEEGGPEVDVIVVGAGNAAACAALAAREAGAGKVLMLEAAPEAEAGGNSTYTAGAMRVTYEGIDDLRELVPDVPDDLVAVTDFGSYGADAFFDDMFRMTQFRTDPELVEILVRQSLPTLRWMREQGVRFQLSFGRQAYKVDGRFRFWGGLACEVWGGGPGLVEMLHAACARRGIEIRYATPATDLLRDDAGVCGVMVATPEGRKAIRAGSVVLACGGFESNAEMRARYLGPDWDLAKVRGTRFNMGDGIRMALEAGAMPHGHWSGAHAVGWDRDAPAYGDLAVGDNYQKHSYPFGIMVNANGERFVDEGADFRNYTYAKYGREVLRQPGMFAWQVFDAKVLPMLRDEYRIREVTKVTANTLEELAGKLEGVDPARFLQTVRAYNAAVQTSVPFNPAIRDGRGTEGLALPKSNWANTLDQAPFEAYAITCGVTFTFGGVKVSDRGEVMDRAGAAIPGLYSAGEMVGGIFYHNYPGGTGLTSGAVFGKLAGKNAGRHALSLQTA